MEKNLLLIMMCVPVLLSAQNNGVTVSNLVVTSGSPGTVTFDVSWDKTAIPPEVKPWSDTVWVFVDYNDNGTMKRLPVTDATASAGMVIKVSGNDQGVWVVGNTKTAGSGNFSATVQLFTGIANIAGACAYASNYPPVGEYISDTTVSFTGTPMYNIILKDGSSSESTWYSSGQFRIPPGYTLESFSDKTGAPGTFHCIPPAAPIVAEGEFCYEQSGELQATASGSVTIEWYDAITGGRLLHTGNVLSLTPLYDASAQYYAQAVADGNCRSMRRTKAEYTVSNCMISGDCPGYTAGNVGATGTPVACVEHYAGQIGVTGSSASSVCLVHDAGRIGKRL